LNTIDNAIGSSGAPPERSPDRRPPGFEGAGMTTSVKGADVPSLSIDARCLRVAGRS
jgi:hypothetical protein